MSKHTKLPWSIENDCVMLDAVTEKPVTGKRLYGNGFKIAEIYGAEPEDLQIMLTGAELLEALRQCEGYLIADVRAEEAKGDKQNHLHGAKEMLRRIEAAINKAEGKPDNYNPAALYKGYTEEPHI